MAKWPILLVLVFSSALAHAGTLPLPPIPAEAPAKVLPSAPEEWRDYFARAREADRIADPLKRCLAYPDFPGNHWPAGHAAAHCRFRAEVDVPVLGLDAVAAYLDRGDLKGLHATLDGYLAKHYEPGHVDERLYTFFAQFNAQPRSDELSKRWLQQAPNDAYAMLARADYLLEDAWHVRGDKFVAETSSEQLENMRALLDRAEPLFHTAIAANRRLLPAYVNLLSLAMLEGNGQLGDQVQASADDQDPADMALVHQRLRMLTPRWGGSYERMALYISQLTPQLGRQPAIAMYFAQPYLDKVSLLPGDRAYGSDAYGSVAADLLNQAVDAGSLNEALHDAADVAFNRKDAPPDNWRGLALLLQLSRFRFGENDAWSAEMIGWRLLREEPEWALNYLVPASKAGDHQPYMEYLLGAAYYNAHQFQAADAHYHNAVQDPNQRQASLEELSDMWLNSAGLSHERAAVKAKPLVDQLLAYYPRDGRGWVYRFQYQVWMGESIQVKDMKTFLALADRTDPVQKRAAESFDEVLKRIESRLGTKH
jgi:hypothetical protein